MSEHTAGPWTILRGFPTIIVPSVQSVARTAIKAVEKWAIVRDLLPAPITLGTEVIKRDGGHTPWTDEQVALAENFAGPHLARVITLAATIEDHLREHPEDVAGHLASKDW